MEKTQMETQEIIEKLNKKLTKDMSLEAFSDVCKQEGFIVRITECNNRGLFVTMNYRTDRVNVATVAPIITEEIIDKDGKKFISTRVDETKHKVVRIESIG